MVPAATIFLDLGDVFTKGLAVDGQGRTRRVRFPSTVARALLDPSGPVGADDLALEAGGGPLRPLGYEPARHPRADSYPGGAAFLRAVRGRLDQGAVLCGWLAAAYGADRQVLGLHPSPANVALLARKALLACAPSTGMVDVVLIVDTGAKARVIGVLAGSLSGELHAAGRSFRGGAARRVRLDVRAHLVDAAACAAAAVRQEPPLQTAERLVLLDVGYFRTKLAIVSEALGCELQTEHLDLGMADCVRRLLRDAQGEGLVVDEYALLRALEERRDHVELGGRRVAVGGVLAAAEVDLAASLARVVRGELLGQYRRSVEPCRAAAILGGGAVHLGARLADLLQAADLGLRTLRVTPDPSFTLVEGARRLWAAR